MPLANRADEDLVGVVVVIPIRAIGIEGDWDQGGEAYVGTRRLTLAAMMKSFSCNPLIAWVRNRTVQ